MAEPTNKTTDADAKPLTGAAIEPVLSQAPADATPRAEEVADALPSSSMPTFTWDSWSQDCRRLGQESQTDFEGSRAKLKRAVAMLAIEIAKRPDHDWAAEAADRNLFVPGSHACMPATAATFGANASDKVQKTARAAFLDRTALAVQYLKDEASKKPTAYTADDIGIAAMTKFIDDKDGLTAVAALQRVENIKVKNAVKGDGTLTETIDLDPVMVRGARIERAREQLKTQAGGTSSAVKVALVLDDGTTQVIGAVIDAADEQVDALLLEMNSVDPLVDQLGELLQAGKMVAEPTSTELKNMLDNPEAPANGFRSGFRHFVFQDDLPITISPILTSTSVIVEAMPLKTMLDRKLGVACHLRTEPRRVLEANIADPARRGVFSAKVEGPGKTKGKCRIVVSTGEAKDQVNNGKDIGVLMEPLHSEQGNLPLAFDASRFKPTISGTFKLRAWKKRHEDFIAKQTQAEGKKADVPLKHHFTAGGWKIAATKKPDEADMDSTGTNTDVSVNTGDFYRVSQAISTLPVIGDIAVDAERRTGICLTFTTRQFEYQVYIPAITSDNVRTTNLLAPFTV